MGLLAAAALFSALFALCAGASLKRLFQGQAPLLNTLCLLLTLPLIGFWIHHLSPFDLGFANDTGDGWATVLSFLKCLASAILGALFHAWAGARHEDTPI